MGNLDRYNVKLRMQSNSPNLTNDVEVPSHSTLLLENTIEEYETQPYTLAVASDKVFDSRRRPGSHVFVAQKVIG